MRRPARLVTSLLVSVVLLATAAIGPAVGHGPEPRPMLGADAHADAGATIAAMAAPSGFDDRAVLSGLVHPTAIQFASDGRIFVAEKRGTIKVFDSLTDTTPTRSPISRPRSRTTGTGDCSGMALPRSSRPTRPCTSCTRTTRRSAARRRAGTTRCPTPPGSDDRRVRRQWPPVPAAGKRQRQHGARAGADQRLVPAVSEPLDRHRGVRARRCAVRERRRRRELLLCRLRPGRRIARRHADTGQPVRRSRQRGWRAAEPGHPHDAQRWRLRRGLRRHGPRRRAGRLLAAGRGVRHRARPSGSGQPRLADRHDDSGCRGAVTGDDRAVSFGGGYLSASDAARSTSATRSRRSRG